MNNIQPYGAVSEEQVRKLERRYHIQLPAGYREFLLTYGGGKAEDRSPPPHQKGLKKEKECSRLGGNTLFYA